MFRLILYGFRLLVAHRTIVQACDQQADLMERFPSDLERSQRWESLTQRQLDVEQCLVNGLGRSLRRLRI